jgi:hypothetical protein
MGGSNGGESQATSITGINVTPLVDVVLVLLIIFMAAAPLIHRRAMNVNVPRAAHHEPKATDTLLNLSKPCPAASVWIRPFMFRWPPKKPCLTETWSNCWTPSAPPA